jgi:hypothetical protein
MQSLRFRTILATLAILMLRPAATLQAARVSTAGRYHVVLLLTCRNTPQNAHACATADNQQYAVFGKTGTTFADSSTVDAVVDSHGKFTYKLAEVVAERGVPHAGPYCGENVNTVAFNGSCRITQTGGKGFIAKGATGLKDFFATESTINFFGRTTKSIHVKDAKGIDTLAPAAAGHWNTAHYLALLGVKPVPSGITVTLTVAHR